MIHTLSNTPVVRIAYSLTYSIFFLLTNMGSILEKYLRV